LLIDRRQHFRIGLERSEGVGPGQTLGLFTVDGRDLLDVPGQGFDVPGQFVFIGMAAEGVDGGDTRADFVRFAEDVDRVVARENLRAQRVLRALAD